MTDQQLYFGPSIDYATNPHEVDYQNEAIQLRPRIQRARGEIHISLYLSAVNLEPVNDAKVVLFWGDPNHQATWFDPARAIDRWKVKFQGGQLPFPRAPVENCIWKGETTWVLTKEIPVHDRRFVLAAAVVWEAAGQMPTQTVPASDPCVAVFNSLTVTDRLPEESC